MAIFSLRKIIAIAVVAIAAGCAGETPKHLQPLSYQMKARLTMKGLEAEAPIVLRIFKEESELEVWKRGAEGRFAHVKTYPICQYSGVLGPKTKEGDRQAPEGFYTIRPAQMNPLSNYYLSFNIGYPNVYDRARRRTGKHLMVHGDCSSAGCYSMTDDIIADIYSLAREAFDGGQEEFQIQAYPFRMTAENMQRHKKNRWYEFWLNLKQGYDAFEAVWQPPKVDVCGKRYVFNASFTVPDERIDPAMPCPAYVTLAAPPQPPAPAVKKASYSTSSVRSETVETEPRDSGEPVFGAPAAAPRVEPEAIRQDGSLGKIY